MSYLHFIVVMICLYSLLGLSLNLVVGYGGMLSLCHAGFYGIGAYISTVLMTKSGWPYGASLLAAVLGAGMIAEMIAAVSIRFHGDFFVLATMGFQVIIFSVLYNWTGLTNGPYGISGIPKPSLFGFEVSSDGAFMALVATAATVAYVLVWRLSRSAYGRALQAVRDDEIAAQALGKDVRRFRRSAFSIAAMIAAGAGVLYAGYVGYIDPTSFGIDEAVFILCAVIIGGAGDLRGPLVGAVILVALPELLRFVQLPDAIAANARQVLYGLLLVLMMRFRPQGIVGRYAFD